MSTDLSLLFNPRSIAVVGARDGLDSLGGRVVSNIVEHSHFHGDLYLVNPGRKEVRGRRCWDSMSALPQAPDVVVIVVPAVAAVAVLKESAERGARFAIILSSGFSEAGEEGLRLQDEIRRIVDGSSLRAYGPNCPGLFNMVARIGLSFSPSFATDLRTGPIGLVLQGGGLGRGIVQAMDRGFGVALWASTGNEVDLQAADFIEHYADAPEVKVITVVLEGIKDGPRFLAALQRAGERGKPVVLLKIGKSEYGAKAALSHTASISGSAEVNSAVFRQFGVVEVDDIDELVDVAWLLMRHPPDPRSAVHARNDIAVYGSSGGTAALVADIVGAQGVTLAQFTPETTEDLRRHLPAYAAFGNPVDTTTIVLSQPEIVDVTLGAVCRDPGVSMVLFPVPADYGTVTLIDAQSVIRVQARSPVPIVPVWITDRRGLALAAFAESDMMPILSVQRAAKAVKRWGAYARWKAAPRDDRALPPPAARAAPGAARAPMSEPDAKRWLEAAGIRVPRAGLASNADEAARIAQTLGYPVVLKVVSAAIQHKSEVGGVALGLAHDDALRQAWRDIEASVAARAPGVVVEGMLVEAMAAPHGAEILIGVSRDPTFGHAMTIGLGGIYVELFQDVARRLLPVSAREAAVMLRELRAFAVLDGARGRPRRDVAALCRLVAQVSDFVMANVEAVEELELNPVWVGHEGEGVVALDALIIARRPLRSTPHAPGGSDRAG